MKKKKSNRIISIICVLMILFTSLTTITAVANTHAGFVSIKANNQTTKINDVTKTSTDRYSSIFMSNSTAYFIKVWVKDTTNSKVLTEKTTFLCLVTSKGHWIPYKSGVSFSNNDNLRFYGSQGNSSSRGLTYVIYDGKATL